MLLSKNKIFYLIIVLIWVLAVVLRVNTYLAQRPLWLDEASLAMNILNRDSLLSFFTPLDFYQKAPPLFMILTKLLTNLFDEKELTLRIIPFICSIASIFLFYKVSTKVFTGKISVLAANYFFAINWRLLHYSQEFKPYMCDLAVMLVAMLCVEKLNFETLSYKKIILYSFITILLVLFSFPVIYAVGAIIVMNLIRPTKEKIKKIICYALPLIFVGIYIILPLRNDKLEWFSNYWNDGFLLPNIHSVLAVLKSNLTYFLFVYDYQNLLIILFLAGLYLFIKEVKTIQIFAVLVLTFSIIASFAGLYPLKERLILYLLPTVILLITKPLDTVSFNKKAYSLIILAIYILCFAHYNVHYLKRTFDINKFCIQDSRSTLKNIVDNIKEGDILIISAQSREDYQYYKKYFNFKPKNEIILTTYMLDEKEYLEKLNNLDKCQNYWFYFPHHLYKRPEKLHIQNWVKQNGLNAEFYEYKRSFSAYITWPSGCSDERKTEVAP